MTITSGWVETGVSVSHSGTLQVFIAGVSTDFAIEPLRVEAGADDIFIGLETSGGFISCGFWDSRDSISIYTRKNSEIFAARTIEATGTGGCPQPYLGVTITRVVTGLRLAANVDVSTDDLTTRARYRLWADELTVDTVTVGSKSVVIDHSAGEFLVSPFIQVRHEAIPFLSAPVPPDLANGVILAGASWNGEADPTTFDNLYLRGYLFGVGVGGTVWTYTSRPPLHYRVDADVRDAAGAAPPGVITAGEASITNPGAEDVTHWRWSEIGGTVPVFGRLSGDWSSDGVDLEAGEEVVPLRQLKPKTPQNAPEFWTPTTYEVTSPESVLLSTNNFSGTGPVILSGTGNQNWVISGVGATTTRILAATYDASDGYLTTKHVAGEDVWGWGLYAYLDVNLSAPAAGDVTLVIRWATGAAVPDTSDKTYTIPVAGIGTATYRIDLLFPQEGGPWYAERVDRLTFSGFVNGAYTLNSLELVAVERAYVKLHARGNYSGLTISQDGTFAIGHWGDNPLIGAGPPRQKDDESGYFDYGAGADTSSGGAVRMDGTLEDVALEWNRMEGMVVLYDGSAIDADLQDGTNVIGTEDELVATPLTYSARWYHTQMALRSAPNDGTGLDASLYLDGGADLCPAPEGTFVLPFRHTLGMVLEALCKDSVTSERAGAGAAVFARRSTTGAPTPSDHLMAEGVTDASGFASVAVRVGTVGTVGAAEIYVALLGS